MTRLSLRFLLPLLLVLMVIAYSLLPLADKLTRAWFRRDLDTRSHLVANAIQDTLVPLIHVNSQDKIEAMFTRISRDERLYALAFCDSFQSLRYATLTLPKEIDCRESARRSGERGEIRQLSGGLIHVSSVPVEEQGKVLGNLVVIHDMSFVERRSKETKRYIFYLFLFIGVVISIVTIFIAQLSWRGWVAGLRGILKGEGIFKPISKAASPELQPILKDLKALIRDLESEHRTKDDSRMTWTPRALKEILFDALAGDEVLVVSNREPYIHVRRGEKIEVQFPASGLVTVIEPIMRACSGTWIAHGSSSADKDVVDENNRIRVPPGSFSYQIRNNRCHSTSGPKR